MEDIAEILSEMMKNKHSYEAMYELYRKNREDAIAYVEKCVAQKVEPTLVSKGGQELRYTKKYNYRTTVFENIPVSVMERAKALAIQNAIENPLAHLTGEQIEYLGAGKVEVTSVTYTFLERARDKKYRE